MSCLVVLKEGSTVLLGSDSRVMRPDCSGVATDVAAKVVELAPRAFLAASGWQYAIDAERVRARQLARELPDIREASAILRRELIWYLKGLADASRSVEGLHTYGGSEVSANVPIHASVMIGENAAGERGYIVAEYSLRGGEVICDSHENFGTERTVWARPAESVMELARTAWNDEPVSLVRRFLDTIKTAVPHCGGQTQIVQIDQDGAKWIDRVETPSLAEGGWAESAINVGAGGVLFRNGGPGNPYTIVDSDGVFCGSGRSATSLVDGALKMSNQQVLTNRQSGPGNPSFSSLGDAQTWCQNLLNALRTYGLVT